MDEYDEVKLVMSALTLLTFEDEMWRSNRLLFGRYADKQRIIWWRRAKKQAEAGVPAMQQLLLKVIELRLKG
jgi:hypothetical protein